MSSREVWKLGGTSVDTVEKRALIGRKVAAEVGTELVVVVSAAAGETDRLIRDVSAIPGVPQHVIDAYVATGEMQSAALIAAAIHAAGRQAEVVPPDLLFSCNDRFGDADVIDVDRAPLLDRVSRGVVPVVPGFVGRSPDGRTCVLGRGGSDYSAVLIGAALRARVVLLKNDTDGIYSADPNKHAGGPFAMTGSATPRLLTCPRGAARCSTARPHEWRLRIDSRSSCDQPSGLVPGR